MSKKKKGAKGLPVFAYDGSFTKVLLVVAHPDDIDFGSAGTVATLTGAGVEVSYCLVTSGDAGGDDSTHTKEERAAIRETEQTAAAAVLGVSDLTFLRLPDGLVEPTILLRREITRVIRRQRPDLVICQNPERNWERIFASHPDHMAAGEATMRAVYPDARNPHAFPELLQEGLDPHTVTRVWLQGHPQATFVVDITDRVEQKLAALRAHESQVGGNEQLETMIRTWGRTQAKNAGLGKHRYAESFKEVVTG